MNISNEVPPAAVLPAVAPRLRAVLQGLIVLAGLGFAILGLGLLEGSLDPALTYPMTGCGFAALVAAGALRLKARRPQASPNPWWERWLLYLGVIVVLLPLVLLAGGSLLFFLFGVQMISDPGYHPQGPPMHAPVGELILSAAALAGLVWLLAYVLFVINRDY